MSEQILRLVRRYGRLCKAEEEAWYAATFDKNAAAKKRETLAKIKELLNAR